MPRPLRRRTAPALLLALAGLTLLPAPDASAQAGKKPATKPQPPKPKAGNIGTRQMAGSEGQVGVTYSLERFEFAPRFNLTITGVSYSVGRFPLRDQTLTAIRTQKLLVIRYVLQNPNKEDIELGAGDMTRSLFQAVANDNKTYESEGDFAIGFIEAKNLAPGKPNPYADLKMKPGQKSETLVSIIPIPADATVPKLIVRRGRVGTSEQVLRYDLRDKITSDFGIFADPANPTTPRAEIAALAGTAYPVANLEIKVADLKREAAPPHADIPAEEGREFITGTVTIKNLSAQPRGLWDTCRPVIALIDEDGERKVFDLPLLKGNRSEFVQPGEGQPLEERRATFYFSVPKGVKYKKLEVHEWNFLDLEARRLVYDVSAL
jgi:hypothetical protein